MSELTAGQKVRNRELDKIGTVVEAFEPEWADETMYIVRYPQTAGPLEYTANRHAADELEALSADGVFAHEYDGEFGSLCDRCGCEPEHPAHAEQG